MQEPSTPSAQCEFVTPLVSRSQRMSGLMGRAAACRSVGEWPVWAVLTAWQLTSQAGNYYLLLAFDVNGTKVRVNALQGEGTEDC